ncbi:YecR family lipoprotein [Stutzerimonas nitrititolerans]|uniref:YecR family lipoprotein n=1 Tax=Stutzerimonas nitrititolerans TaxID=2482751 RepID=UPI0028A7FC4B|nr:YecR family lipoprotein [Stutzerimonas nitrititolerans]
MNRTHRMVTCVVASTLAAVALTGCAVNKDFYAMGGSRADGTVDMAYDFAQFEEAVINHQQAATIAKQKCGVWGYDNAEPFGGQTTNCYQRNGWGTCIAGQVVIKYQCVGDIDAARPMASVATASPAATGAALLTAEKWKLQQLQRLQSETGLTYEEYQQRYKQLMGQ